MEKTDNEMNVLANSKEPAVIVPSVVEVVQVQVALVGVTVKVRDVPVAIPILPDRTVLCDISSKPPSFEFSQDCI